MSAPARPAKTSLPIYSDVEINDLPDPTWLVGGFMQEQTVTGLSGEEASAKSFFVLDLSLSIGIGQPFHGREVIQGDVVYLCAEGSPNLKYRVRAWKREHGLRDEDSCNVWFIPTAVDLTDRRSLKDLIDTVRQTVPGPIRLVAIDTLARCFGDKDENATRDMNTFTNHCHAIKEEFDCAVMVIHHTGWENSRERGNRSFRNNIDTLAHCTMSAKRVVTIECRKQKDAAFFEPFRLQLTEVSLGDAGTSCVLRDLGDADLARIELHPEASKHLALLATGATFTEWRNAAEQEGIRPSTFKRHREALIRAGYVNRPPAKSSRGFKYTLTAEGEAAFRDGSGVQTAVDPRVRDGTDGNGSGPTKAQPQVVKPNNDTVRSNSGPNRSMSPSAHSGPRGGAYRAPHEPEAPKQDPILESEPAAEAPHIEACRS